MTYHVRHVAYAEEITTMNSRAICLACHNPGITRDYVMLLIHVHAEAVEMRHPQRKCGANLTVSVNSRDLRVFVLSFVRPPTRETTVFNISFMRLFVTEAS